MTFSFENLEAYKKAQMLVGSVYDLTRKFPQFEMYALASQLRRAIVSVPSNLAEGSGRCSTKEKVHFIEIAFGSLMESYCQLSLAQDLGYITEEDVMAVKPDFFEVSRLLSGLKNSFSTKLNP